MLEEYLSQQFPEIEDLRLRNLSKFGAGWETELYRLSISGAQGLSLDLVLRMYGAKDPVEKAEKEFALLTGVRRYGIATPQVHGLVADPSILGDPFILMEYVAGGTLEAKLRRGGHDRWLDPMMHALTRIHAASWSELLPRPLRPVPRPDAPLAFVRGMLGHANRLIDRFSLSDFESTMDWLHEREALGVATVPALVHNDYHPQNILVRNEELLIIDWSFAEVGDYRMDLAWTVMLLSALLGGSHRDEILEAYERSAGAPVENFEYFEVLKFTMRMITIATWLEDDFEIPVPGITKQAIRGDYRIHVLNPYHRLREITDREIQVIEDL